MGEACSRLSEEERRVIRIEIGNGTSIRRIGLMLGRNASTVSREIERDTWFPSNENESCRPYRPKRLKTGPWTGGCYIAGPARRKAGRRRAKPRRRYRLSCERLWARVAEWLGRGWSPLLIGGGPRVLFPDDSAMRVCPQTVYRWIHADRHRRERRARRLPRGHRRRRRRGGGRTSRFPIPGRVPISERPPEAGDRSGFGHWEADGVIGAGCDLHTEVERKTRFLNGRDRARQDRRGKRRGAAGDVLAAAGRRARRRHARQRYRVRPPHAPARRAGHGHVLRRPVLQPAAGKQRERERHDPPVSARTRRDPEDMAGELREIVDEADNRPMRVLDYRTPAEAFADELLELQDQQGCCTSK